MFKKIGNMMRRAEWAVSTRRPQRIDSCGWRKWNQSKMTWQDNSEEAFNTKELMKDCVTNIVKEKIKKFERKKRTTIQQLFPVCRHVQDEKMHYKCADSRNCFQNFLCFKLPVIKDWKIVWQNIYRRAQRLLWHGVSVHWSTTPLALHTVICDWERRWNNYWPFVAS